MPEIIDPAQAAQRLQQAHTIAVLGASSKPHRAGFYVGEYLFQQGYRVIPVNPKLVGTQMWGEIVRGSLNELDEPIDMVDAFRRSVLLADHLPELLALKP
ncbi:MAG: putative CoA-binding protein, partial [Kiritimatiellia bacterium]